MILRICGGFLIVLGIVSLIVRIEAGALFVILGAGMFVLDDYQRKQIRKNG
jgi:hypothetical protein